MPRLNHIAVLVASVDEAARLFTNVWGLEPADIVILEKQGIRTATYRFDNITVELMEPYGDDSVVARSLEKRGPGIHHMAVEVDDVASRMDALKADGLSFTTDAPSVGLDDTLVCFLHPKSTMGILTELVQPPKE
jgi:methylmalonyl-CoA/ethylmalonyl-CoA epimerase